MIDPVMQAMHDVITELKKARAKFQPMNSPHEGWATIYEELDELFDHVRANTGRSPLARKEAMQVAAMGLRYMIEVCDGEDIT